MARTSIPKAQRARNAGISLPPRLIRTATERAHSKNLSLSAFAQRLLLGSIDGRAATSQQPARRPYEIRHRFSGLLLWAGEYTDLISALIAALACGIDLEGADFEREIIREWVARHDSGESGIPAPRAWARAAMTREDAARK